MLIEIDKELYNKMVKIIKQRNTTLYNQIKDIEPLDNLNQDDTLTKARTIKTNNIKKRIKDTLISLLDAKETPTKYKVHKITNIAYITLTKYYDEVLKEVQNEH